MNPEVKKLGRERIEIPALDAHGTIKKRVQALLQHTDRVDITTKELRVLEQKFDRMIQVIRKCLTHPENIQDIAKLFTKTMHDLKSMEMVRDIYSLTPLDLEAFSKLTLTAQFVYLFAQQRSESLPGAVCHHWAIFWYNFWKECRQGTLFEKQPIQLCQRTNNSIEDRYDFHSFCLLVLDKRYVISSDAKKGVTMKEAINFSELEDELYRTVGSKNRTPFLEKIRRYKTPRIFAKHLNQIPEKDMQLISMFLSGTDDKI